MLKRMSLTIDEIHKLCKMHLKDKHVLITDVNSFVKTNHFINMPSFISKCYLGLNKEVLIKIRIIKTNSLKLEKK